MISSPLSRPESKLSSLCTATNECSPDLTDTENFSACGPRLSCSCCKGYLDMPHNPSAMPCHFVQEKPERYGNQPDGQQNKPGCGCCAEDARNAMNYPCSENVSSCPPMCSAVNRPRTCHYGAENTCITHAGSIGPVPAGNSVMPNAYPAISEQVMPISLSSAVTQRTWPPHSRTCTAPEPTERFASYEYKPPPAISNDCHVLSSGYSCTEQKRAGLQCNTAAAAAASPNSELDLSSLTLHSSPSVRSESIGTGQLPQTEAIGNEHEATPTSSYQEGNLVVSDMGSNLVTLMGETEMLFCRICYIGS
ncbi:unnamed protein product [Soboliphyme baturini]|uniref:TIL domain-containing protein n=1 Tax=Soboliphyme baturini TaxID=241478 RepID=A0A183IC69_9BILA|nr:unnamed protein product [Soboliphyme baturini]